MTFKWGRKTYNMKFEEKEMTGELMLQPLDQVREPGIKGRTPLHSLLQQASPWQDLTSQASDV